MNKTSFVIIMWLMNICIHGCGWLKYLLFALIKLLRNDITFTVCYFPHWHTHTHTKVQFELHNHIYSNGRNEIINMLRLDSFDVALKAHGPLYRIWTWTWSVYFWNIINKSRFYMLFRQAPIPWCRLYQVSKCQDTDLPADVLTI